MAYIIKKKTTYFFLGENLLWNTVFKLQQCVVEPKTSRKKNQKEEEEEFSTLEHWVTISLDLDSRPERLRRWPS